MNKKLNNLLSFLKKITKKDIKIGIIGLGYTGLPLAIQIRKKGFVIFGFDVDKKISNLKKGVSYIDRIKNIDLRKFSKKLFSSNFTNIQYCDVIIICVPTPLKKQERTEFRFYKKYNPRYHSSFKKRTDLNIRKYKLPRNNSRTNSK